MSLILCQTHHRTNTPPYILIYLDYGNSSFDPPWLIPIGARTESSSSRGPLFHYGSFCGPESNLEWTEICSCDGDFLLSSMFAANCQSITKSIGSPLKLPLLGRISFLRNLLNSRVDKICLSTSYSQSPYTINDSLGNAVTHNSGLLTYFFIKRPTQNRLEDRVNGAKSKPDFL